MKKMKLRLMAFVNVLIGSILTLFGCKTSRESINAPIMCLYGVPTATYKISGQVTDTKDQPLQDMQVVIKGYKEKPIVDTLHTNADGHYEATYIGFPTDTLRIVASDPKENYKADSVAVPVPEKKKKGQETNPFDLGEYNIEENIQLEKK